MNDPCCSSIFQNKIVFTLEKQIDIMLRGKMKHENIFKVMETPPLYERYCGYLGSLSGFRFRRNSIEESINIFLFLAHVFVFDKKQVISLNDQHFCLYSLIFFFNRLVRRWKEVRFYCQCYWKYCLVLSCSPLYDLKISAILFLKTYFCI